MSDKPRNYALRKPSPEYPGELYHAIKTAEKGNGK